MGTIVGSTSVSATVTSEPIMVRAMFDGVAQAGPISIPGLRVGDIIIELSDGGSLLGYGSMERTVSTVDQLQQVFAGDLSHNSYTAIFARGL